MLLIRIYREKNVAPNKEVATWIPEKVPFSKKRNRNFNTSSRQDFDDALQLSVKVILEKHSWAIYIVQQQKYKMSCISEQFRF